MTNGDKFFQSLANLECTAGHMHIAKNPKAFVDRQCGTRNKDGQACKRRLDVIKTRGR